MAANAAAQSSNASPFDATPQNSQIKPASLSQQAIIWLVVLSCIVVAAFIIITCLLCKCRKRRNKASGRIERGYSVSDGRNDFQAWNKHVQQPPTSSLPPVPQYGGYGAGVMPLTKAAVRPTQTGSAVMEPMSVDEDAGNGYQTQRRKVGGNRYYSAWAGRISNRFSQQIGRAV